MKGFSAFLTLAVVIAGSCSSSSGQAPASRGLIEAHVDVFGWNDARVAATLIDRNGRRTGWNLDRPIDQIRGCVYKPASEEDTSDEGPATAPKQPVRADTATRRTQPTPMEHYFKICNDAMTAVGLIDQGGCELRLDPVVGGKVRLALLASGVRLSECRDTTSVWVTPGVPSRWWLSWKVTGDKCFVKISRMVAKGLAPSPR
jgi:hypothetical protein